MLKLSDCRRGVSSNRAENSVEAGLTTKKDGLTQISVPMVLIPRIRRVVVASGEPARRY